MNFNKVVLATTNYCKAYELEEVLIPYKDSLFISTCKYPRESSFTFIENAIVKARTASLFHRLPAIADDSGLCVNILNMSPGLYSARYANEDSFEDGCNKLLEDMIGIKDRRAFYYCSLVFLEHSNDICPIVAHGYWHGSIAYEKAGVDGYGYDPIFIPSGENNTVSQLCKEYKKTHSHRYLAANSLLSMMRDKFGT